jgi:peptidoglycan/LPS O-acetylase OafA/YrhL
MKWLGLIAYGAYLAHFPIVHQLVDHGVGDNSFGEWFLASALALAGSIALGALSYYFLEKPILRLKGGRRRSAREPVAATT